MKLQVFTILAIILFGSTANTFAQSNEKTQAIYNLLDTYFNDNVRNGFSGSVLIAKEGNILLSKGYGYADRKAKTPNTSKTVFDIGSNTKQFTATAILKLVALNKINLSDTLPVFFEDTPEDKEQITIHQLLTHSSGLESYSSGNDFEPIAKTDFLNQVFSSELISDIGTSYNYSNIGYSILAIIIEQVSGQQYEEFVNQYLFEPAGMAQTGYLLPEWDSGQIAKGYRNSFQDIGTMIDLYKEHGITWHLKGNGGINSTTEDMYKWYKAMKENIIIPESLKEQQFKPHVVSSIEWNSYYGYGWGVTETSRKTKVISHSGANPAYYSDILWFTNDDVFIIYCSNVRNKEIEYLAWDFQNIIFDQDYIPKPIKKNAYSLVFDFIQNNDPKKVGEIPELIKNEVDLDFKDHNILNRIGLDALGKPHEKWAVPLLKLNVELFPDDGNLWDSLGEAYKKRGEKELAIQSFEKALLLKPEGKCSWCANSRMLLNELNTIVD